MKKLLAIMIVALIAVFAPVGVMAASYKSPVATTRPNSVNDDNDNNNGDVDGDSDNGGGRPGEGAGSATSPVTGDYALFVLAAAMVFGAGSIFAGRKLAKK